ncbi:hypothetical protein PG991_009971 [Apiospora marii]|uniref:Uncharacterized protein n=1 Tax=Apiospora marii TaxID=335849 RepID=A0ABR1RH59_9PEZI
MAQPDYLSLDPDELQEHHKYMLKTGLGEEKFLESEWNCMGMKLKAFLSFDGGPRVQETTEPESKAMRVMRVLCCQIILPNSKQGASASKANDSTEHRSSIKGTELPPAAADMLASIREKRRLQKGKEEDEAYYRHHKVERYDWNQYDPDASDDDVDVWKVKPSSEPDELSVASYEPCSPSDDGSSIGSPVLPSDFGASTLSFGASLLTGPERPPLPRTLPSICARTVPPVLSSRSLDKRGVGDSVGVSHETRRRRDPTQDGEHRTLNTQSVDPPRVGNVPGNNTPFAASLKSRESVSSSGPSSPSSSSSSATSANSRDSTIRPGSSQGSVVMVIESVTPKSKVSLARSPSNQKARLTTEHPVIHSEEENPPPEDQTRPPTTARPRLHSRRKSLQMPMASPRIGERSRPPLSGSAYGGSRNYCGCDADDCRECRETTTPEKYFPFEHQGALLIKRDSKRHSQYYT